MYWLCSNGGTPCGRFGGAFPAVEESRCAERVAEGMETLLLLSPRLLVMWRVLATLTMAEALLEEHVDAAEKLLEGCRELTLSTLVYVCDELEDSTEAGEWLFWWLDSELLSCGSGAVDSSLFWPMLVSAVECWGTEVGRRAEAAGALLDRGPKLDGSDGDSGFGVEAVDVVSRPVGVLTPLKPLDTVVGAGGSSWGDGARLLWKAILLCTAFCSKEGPGDVTGGAELWGKAGRLEDVTTGGE